MNKKELLIIAVATLITACAWIIFDILHKRSEVVIDPKVQQIIAPIDPDFDTEGLDLER